MLKAEQVPETVAHAAEAAWSKGATWQQIVAAALDVWPFKEYHSHHCLAFGGYGPAAIILPLPAEKSNVEV